MQSKSTTVTAYLALYVMDPKLVAEFRPRLKGLNLGKGCIRFQSFADLPTDAIAALLRAAAERRKKGTTKKACN